MKPENQTDKTYLVYAPGRVNLLGEHVDYNGGMVLPAAIDRAVQLAAMPEDKNLVVLQARAFNQTVIFRIEDIDSRKDFKGQPLPAWALYPAGIAWALQKNGFKPGGIRAVYSSDLPIGAGLSSSAAVEIAFALLWQAIGGWEIAPMTLAKICLQAEREFIGVNCGLMDQFACLYGVDGHALYFDTRSLEWQAVALPENISLVAADSRLPHTLAGSAYNERRAECEEALFILKSRLPGISFLRDVSPRRPAKTRRPAIACALPPRSPCNRRVRAGTPGVVSLTSRGLCCFWKVDA